MVGRSGDGPTKKNPKREREKKKEWKLKTSSCGMPLICLHHGAEDRRRLKRRPGARSPPTPTGMAPWRWRTLQTRKSCFPGRVTRDELSRRETAENELVGPRRSARTYCRWHALRAARQFPRGPPRPILSRRPRVNRMKWANSAFSSPWWEKKHGFRKSENFPARVGG